MYYQYIDTKKAYKKFKVEVFIDPASFVYKLDS